jgi:NADPH:quinone reductase-like Zn-dependent oxidoreductase
MRAAIRDTYGGPDIVRVEEVEKCVPNVGEVVVRVEAASVNRADLDALRPRPGFARLFTGIRAPRNRRLGVDAAGVVEGVGGEVTKFQPGDRVFTDLFTFGFRTSEGAFADQICGPEEAFQTVPAGMSFEDAATLPHSAVLAVQGLRLRDGRTPRPGDQVLIDGASGNVGPFAVQIAKSMGCEVTAVASATKLDFVRSLGADHVIDYATTDYTRTGERYDWIVDTDSHHSLFSVRRALRPNGVYVTLGGTSWPILAAILIGPFLSLASGKRLGLMLWWKPFHPPDVQRIEQLIAAGHVKPVIDRRYPLDQVVEALRWVDDGHARGKVVITG